MLSTSLSLLALTGGETASNPLSCRKREDASVQSILSLSPILFYYRVRQENKKKPLSLLPKTHDDMRETWWEFFSLLSNSLSLLPDKCTCIPLVSVFQREGIMLLHKWLSPLSTLLYGWGRENLLMDSRCPHPVFLSHRDDETQCNILSLFPGRERGWKL